MEMRTNERLVKVLRPISYIKSRLTKRPKEVAIRNIFTFASLYH